MNFAKLINVARERFYMAQPKPERMSFDKVLRLVAELSLAEQEQLRLQLNNKSWGERWDALVQKVREQNREFPPVTDAEVVAEMKAIRKELWNERAQSNH